MFIIDNIHLNINLFLECIMVILILKFYGFKNKLKYKLE